MPDLTLLRRSLVLTVACWLVGWLSDPVHISADASGSKETAVLGSIIGTAFHGAQAIYGWATGLHRDHPTLFWTLVVVIGMVVIALNLHRLAALGQRDPQRMYDSSQRTTIHQRAGGRCEHKHPFWMRCTRPSSHADHVYPWSRGGATTIANGQALCASHNLRKSNHVPSRLYLWRLQRRRRRYFPAEEPRVVDWTIITATY